MIVTNLTLNGKEIPNLYPLPKGTLAPYFSGIDQFGRSFSLESLKEKGSAVMFFYSGFWCNYCTKKLESFQQDLLELSHQGVNILVVTSEGEEFSNESFENSEQKVPVIIDFNHTIMKSYNVAFKSSELNKYKDDSQCIKVQQAPEPSDLLPIPATYIINPMGVIEHVHFNPNFEEHMSAQEVKQLMKI